MKTTVIIPIFRGERYLPGLLQAIQTQDLEDLEVLPADMAALEGPQMGDTQCALVK